MARMVVTRTKPVRYPSGPEGKEYTLGQEFEVASERDAKALGLIRAAALVDDKKKGKVATKVQTAAESSEPATVEPVTVEQAVEQPKKYSRRDMRAED